MIDIQKLHPAIRKMTQDFLDKAKSEGIDLRLTFGIRTFEEQQALYDQGRSKPGKIVTKAKPGQSFHNYGLAIDVCPFENGKLNWDSKQWSKIAEIGKSIGFQWGGDWQNFKDIPHFEYPKATSYRVLLSLKNTGKVDQDGFVIIPTVQP